MTRVVTVFGKRPIREMPSVKLKLDDEAWQKIRALKARYGLSYSAIVRLAVTEWLRDGAPLDISDLETHGETKLRTVVKLSEDLHETLTKMSEKLGFTIESLVTIAVLHFLRKAKASAVTLASVCSVT